MTPLRARAGAGIATLLLALCAADLRAEEPATAAAAAPAAAPAPVQVVLHTESGDIVVALDAQHAPLTTANFLLYVDQKRFDGGAFYRAVKVDEEGHYGLVQGGLDRTPRPARPGKGPKPIPPVPHEPPSMTGLHHVDGAISMARKEPGTATSDFFIVIGDLTSLDGGDGDPGYAVFGHVESGMDVVTGMLGLPRSADVGDGSMAGQMLANPVKILSARRVRAADRPAPTP